MSVLTPSLLVAGVVCMALPLLIRLLVRRRVVSVSWGAMRLLQDSMRWRSRTRLLRVLLFMLRSCIPLIAALTVAGVILGWGGFTQSQRIEVVLLDDTINAWVEGQDGRRGIDDHIEAVQTMLNDGESFDIVTLTGRHLGPVGMDFALSVTPSPSGPQWTKAIQLVQRLLSSDETTAAGRVLLLSELRNGLLNATTTLPKVDNHFTHGAPTEKQRSSIQVVHLSTARSIMLPGDPLASTQVQMDLIRQGPLLDPLSTTILLEQQVPSTGELTVVDTASFEWSTGARKHSAFLTLPQKEVHTALRASIKGHTSPSSRRWIHIRRHTIGEVTLVSESSGQPFDPSLAASWLHKAIEMDQQASSLQTTHVHPGDLLIETLSSDMPLVVSNAGALSVDTWLTLLDQQQKTPIIVFPSPTSDADDLRTLVMALEVDRSPGGELDVASPTSTTTPLTTLHPSSSIAQITIPPHAGSLELLRPELVSLLSGLQVDRLVDLSPLVESGHARSLVNRGEQPLFIAVKETPLVIGAIAWHPSWSDLPLRPAAPAILQELLRAGVDGLADESVVASGANAVTGPSDDGTLVQADIGAADQEQGGAEVARRLSEAGWNLTSGPVTAAMGRDATRRFGWIFSLILLAMLILECVLAKVIDRPRRKQHAIDLQQSTAS